MANPKIQLRHDTAANWTSVNPVLLEGEVGIETDTKKQKIGDGSTPWNNLAYDLGSTALQSIASSDVTNALGYTPVNKAGDTMTGGLILEDTGATAFCQKYPNITYNTAPSSSNSYGGIAALDTNLNWMGIWAVERYADNHTVVKMQGKSRTGVQGRLQLKSRTDGSWVAEAPTPLANSDTNEIATTEWVRDIADGQWVNSSAALSTTTSVGTYNISLSSYLPNDNHNYEVLLFTRAYKSGDGNGDIYNDLVPNVASISSYHSFYVTSNSRQFQNYFIFPVSTQRNITVQITTACSEFGLYALAYRRIGTNS